MIIRNGTVLTDRWQFETVDLVLNADRITAVLPREGPDVIAPGLDSQQQPFATAVFDAAGLLVVPGLFDIHIHGCAGHDFCDADPAGLAEMAWHLARSGITSFLGTTMAQRERRLVEIFASCQKATQKGSQNGAVLQGIHLEGPFLAVEKKGAQAAEFIFDPDLELYKRLERASDGTIKIIDIAPERPGALALIAHAAANATVALAHSTADYETATQAFGAGASHVTHLFNAIPPFHHRAPGIVGAASDAQATVEIICDGVHLHPSVVRAVFKWFGAERVVLVSDAMRACGLPDGQYELGGQAVTVQGNRATLIDGTLAGSVTDLMGCVRNAVEFGIPLTVALRAASGNPAQAARLEDQIGSLSVGKKADILLVRPDLAVEKVMIDGAFIDLD
jgi:N-acetylglucosamine-6-phosphate deacetylase